MNDLIINGIDHSKFDLEWAKRGGVVFFSERAVCRFVRMTTQDTAQLYRLTGTRGVMRHEVRFMRMATPSECDEAGIEYIEPPVMWRDIESAPKDGTKFDAWQKGYGRLIDVSYLNNDLFKLVNGMPVSDITHWMPLPKPPKDE